MQTQIQLGNFDLAVVRKDIKNLHLSVHPPTGRVTIAAPKRMSLDTVRVFALSKLPWLRQQRRQFQAQDRETPRDYINRESHYLWGKRYLLTVQEGTYTPSVEIHPRRLILRARPCSDHARRKSIIESWYRETVRAAAQTAIQKWEPLMGVKVRRLFVRRMRTKWGSCNRAQGYIRLNTDLAKKPKECLEYIVVHEMVHLLHPTHGPAFIATMDRLMPKWQLRRTSLNLLPLRHEEWNR